jgi:ferric enterobactin receptor
LLSTRSHRLIQQRNHLLRSALLCALFFVAAAQVVCAPLHAQGTREIRGQVVSAANNAPLQGATVEVTLPGKNVIVARTVSTAGGSFRAQGLRGAVYHVRIRSLGYRPWDSSSVNVVSADADLGRVALVVVPVDLQTIAVTEKRAAVQLAPDRNTYVVRDIPAAKGGTALDVLRTVPAVDVDIDNVVSLRGNSGVTIQINGRPSPLKPAQLGDFLAQLPADVVDRVEVVPNPSARDDPTGVAGIINLVLKEEVDAGTTGGLTLTGATTGQANVGGNVGYEHKGFTLYGSYSFLRDNRPRSEALFRTNEYVTPLTYLDETSLRRQARRIHTLTGNAGYALTGHDDLSLELLLSTRQDKESSDITYRTLDIVHTLTELTDRLSRGTNREDDLDATLAFKHTFAQKGHKFAAEVRALRHSEGGPSVIAAHELSSTGALLATTDEELQENLERPQGNSVKIDYTRPLSGGIRMEAGYKGAFDQFHTALNTRIGDPNGSSVPDPSRTNDFVYRQDVNAGYAMLTGQRGKLQFQGGLRAEYAATQFRVAAMPQPFQNNYGSLFPSGLLAYNLDDATQIKLSYSARIRRPDDADQLDPIAHYQDPLNLSRGNPTLQPERTSAIDAGVQRTIGKTTVQLSPYFRRTHDAVRTLRTIDSAGVTTRTFANIATSQSFGGDATLAVGGRRLSGFVGGSAFRQSTDASNLAPGLSLRTFGWRARGNAAYRISKDTDIQALFTYQGAMAVEQGTNGSRVQFNMAGRRKFRDDQLSVTLRVIDPFDTSHERSTTTDPRFVQTLDRSRAIRGLLLSASWTLGKPDKANDVIDLNGDGTP